MIYIKIWIYKFILLIYLDINYSSMYFTKFSKLTSSIILQK